MMVHHRRPVEMASNREKLESCGLEVSKLNWVEMVSENGTKSYASTDIVLGGWFISPVKGTGRWRMKMGNWRRPQHYNSLASAMNYADTWRQDMILSLLVEQNKTET